MTAGNSDALILPLDPAPFHLILAPIVRAASFYQIAEQLRRMGLVSDNGSGDGAQDAAGGQGTGLLEQGASDHIASDDIAANESAANESAADESAAGTDDGLYLRFGALLLHARPATEADCRGADPGDPATTLLGAQLPDGWRDPNGCWTFHLVEGADDSAGRRSFFRLLLLLIDAFEASHFFWTPARLWSDAVQFRNAIDEMHVSGMPPILNLVAFHTMVGDGGEKMRSHGLAHFGGHELETTIGDNLSTVEVIRRLARLSLDVMLFGAYESPASFDGLVEGERIHVTPLPVKAGEPKLVMVDIRSA